jgi:hypothetical protein
MGAVKKWLMEQEEREYDEKLLEANERDDPDVRARVRRSLD